MHSKTKLHNSMNNKISGIFEPNIRNTQTPADVMDNI